MSYKALRNKVYSGSERLMLSDYNGRDYLTNTYIAEEDTELPARKQLTTDTKPNLALATQNKGIEQLLESVVATERDGVEVVELSNSALGLTRVVQRRFYDYIKARYPSVKFATDDYYRVAPVKVYDINRDTDTPVVIVMPLNY